MDCIKIGKLIARLRREKGLTQQQIADALNITNKTVSKWECGLSRSLFMAGSVGHPGSGYGAADGGRNFSQSAGQRQPGTDTVLCLPRLREHSVQHRRRICFLLRAQTGAPFPPAAGRWSRHYDRANRRRIFYHGGSSDGKGSFSLFRRLCKKRTDLFYPLISGAESLFPVSSVSRRNAVFVLHPTRPDPISEHSLRDEKRLCSNAAKPFFLLGEQVQPNTALFQNADCFADRFFIRFPAVFVHLCLILLFVGQAAGAADASADAGHSFNKIAGQNILGGF